MAAFVWGDNGAQMTPEAIAAQRKIAQVMMQRGGDYSPIQSAWQGAARVAEGLMGGLDARSADAAERRNATAEQALLASLMPGATAPVVAPAVAPAVSAAPPVGVPADQAVYPAPAAPPPAPTTFRPGIVAPAGDTSVPRGIRNNNPLNIEAGNFTSGIPGYSGSDGRFARFETPDGGITAANKLLDVYRDKHGLNTVAGIISRWAPTSDGNNVSAYAANVSRQLGIDPNAPIPPEMRSQLIAAMGQHENGRPINMGATPGVQTVAAAMPQSDPAALPANAQPAQGYAVPGQPTQAAPQSGVNPKIAAALASPYVSEGTKKVLGIMLTNQLQGDVVTQVDLGNKVGFADKRGNIIRTIDKGEPNKGPEFGVIGKDEFGNEQYGWKDPRTQTTTPAAKPQAAVPAQPSTIPPVPAGVDPKTWRDTFSKNAAQGATPASFDDTSKLRNEISQLPSYKNMAQAAPIYKSMADAAGRNTKAADLNMVYGLGKIMDPGSVVREGEIQMANNAQGWQEKLNGIVGTDQQPGWFDP
jgi:hypothetical protein